MTKLNTAPNLTLPDDVYAALLEAHDGLSDPDTAALNARLVLILANHIGDHEVILQAITAAKQS